MRVAKVEAWTVMLPLEEPYAVAYAALDSAPNVFVRVETDAGIVGFGSASPDPEVTGETHHTVLRALTEVAEPLLHGEDPLAWRRHLARLAAALPDEPSARAAVDIALHDLLGKAAGLPVFQILGGFRASMATSITIGILDAEATVKRARHWASRGFTRLKIKGGRSCEEDIGRVRRVREAVGAGIGLSFDANQGYGVDEAVRFARGTAAARLEFLEQPVAGADLGQLAEVRRRAGLPVMADEAVLSPGDALEVARHEAADLLNLKLMKAGGLRGALSILDVAAAAGLGAMVGCMDEAALGIAAGLHLALASPEVTFADLDGHIGLIGDPSAGAVHLRDGSLFPNDGPGFGFQGV